MTQKTRRLNSKFRFQLLAQFIINSYKPCKVADIGGGKGLLSLFLRQSGFESWVIDPYSQDLPNKFKDLRGNKVKLARTERVDKYRISQPFSQELAKDFDLLIGLHAHGSNILILNASKRYNKKFLILPCCVVDEPIEKRSGIDWFDSLYNYATRLELQPKLASVNFKGQNRIIYN